MRSGSTLSSFLHPTPSHHPQTIAALDWGVHVLVEKPPAYTVEEMQQMAEASDKAGKHLMVAWNRTFGLLRVKELFAHQPPKVVMADYVRPDPTFLVIIRTHMVDPLYFLCGEPAQVVAKGEMFDEHKEGHVVASIRFQNGSLGQLTGSFGAGGNSERFTAYGDGYTVFVESTSRGQGRIMRGSREVESFGPVDTVQLQIRHFIDCVREDKEPLNSGHDAVRIVRFMWDIMDAAGIGITSHPRR